MRWLRWLLRHRTNGSAQVREAAEQKLQAAKNMTPMVERMAGRVAKLPPDEFADRVAKAFLSAAGMTALVLTEVGFAAVVSLVFIVLYGWRSDWRATPMGRHLMAFMAVLVVELGSLLALAVWPVPAWVFALVFGALDVVVAQRLVLLWQAQHNRRE